MNRNDVIASTDDISTTSGYIMMGLGLLFPIILYALARSVFRRCLDLESMPIVLLFLLLIVDVGVLVYLHVIDYRRLKGVCENTDKLLATVLAYQPIYFVTRQKALGRPTKGAIIYAVISTLEIVGMINVYAIACVRDVLELI